MNPVDALWDFDDPAASEVRFRQALAAERDPVRKAEILTQIGRTYSMRRRFDSTDEELAKAETLLTDNPDDRVQTRLLLEKGRRLNSDGKPKEAKPLFLQAVDFAIKADDQGLQVDALHMVALTEGKNAEPWNRKALAVALASDQPAAQKWAGSIYNNLGWDLFDQGKVDEALACFEGQVTSREKWSETKRLKIARWCLARCLRELGRNDEALAIQLDLVKEPGVFVWEELAYLHQLNNKNPEAKESAQKALDAAGTGAAATFPDGRLEKLREIANL